MTLFGFEKAPWANVGTRHSVWWKIGAFLFALGGVSMLVLAVRYVVRPASASGPSSNRVLNYQIRLTDPAGIPVIDGTRSIKISFYDAATGGTTLATDCGTTGTPTGRKVNFSGGIGTVLIGDTSADGTHNCSDASAPNALPTSLFNSTNLFLGITVDADAEMTPRKRVVATGYSLNADMLDDLDTSSVGGSVAFVPVTDSSGNLTLTKNLTVDGTTMFVDSTNDRVGIGTATPAFKLDVVAGTLPTFNDRALKITATLPTGATSSPFAAQMDFVSGSGTSFSQSGLFINFTDGGLGATNQWSRALVVENSVISSLAFNPGAFSGKPALFANAGGAAVDNIGIYANAGGATSKNIAGHFRATAGGAPTNVGVSGFAQGATTNNIGGYFSLDGYGGASLNASSALIADNGSSAGGSIFLGRDNGTTVFAIADGGNVGVGTATPITQLHVPGSVPTVATGSVATNASPDTVYVQGRYAYVVNLPANTLQIFDVSNAASPILVSTVATGTGPAAISVQGRHAYVTNNGSSTLQIFDVSNPAAPTSVSTVATGATPYAIYVQGRYAYVGNVSGQNFQIFDVSNPAAPVSVGTLAPGGDPYAVSVQGRYAYVVFSSGTPVLRVIDVSNPAAPVSVGSVATGFNPDAVYVQGRYAYVTSYGSSLLQIYDIKNPASPALAGQVATGTFPYDVYVQGRYAYVPNRTSNTLQVFDISNPASPTSVGTVTTGTAPQSVFVQGRYAYVAANTANTLQIFDIGGSYIQQLEAGGVETGTLSVRNNIYGVDASLSGGLTVGSSARIGGNLAVQSTNSAAELGVDLATNGAFASDTAWTKGTGWTIAGGVATKTAGTGSALEQNIAVTNGESYQIIFTPNTTTAGTLTPAIGTVNGSSIGQATGTLSNYELVLTANASGAVALKFTADGAWAGTIDNVTVKQITKSAPAIALSNSNGSAGVEMRPGGVNNALYGFDSGRSATTGHDNTAVGARSLFSNTTGNYNSVLGYGALSGNTNGFSNIAIGYNSMLQNTTGMRNTAVGTWSFESNRTGADNVGIGFFASSNSTTANQTVALGYASLNSLTTGSGNVAVGYTAGNAGTGITTGTNNTFIGNSSGATSATLTNATAIGYNSRVGASNALVLGGTGVDAINVGIGTTTPITQLHVPGRVPTAATGSVATGTQPYDIRVQGRYAYVVNRVSNTLQVFDVSNSGTPVLTGSVATGSGPNALYVQGRYAYVVNFTANTLQVFDIHNPAAPTLAGSTGTSGGGGPFSIHVQGRYAYIANFTGSSLQKFDISNPAAIVNLGASATGSDPRGIFVQGNYAYIVNNSASSLQIFDVTGTASLQGSVATLTNPTAVYVQGRYAYVTINGGSLQVIDVSNPSAPVSAGSVAVGSTPLWVFVQGRYAYVANAGGNTMQVVDVSVPSAPVSVGTVATGTSPNALYVQGRYAYVVNTVSNTLQVFDVGGSYIQQVEAGGIEAGTMSLRGNFAAADAAFTGGVSIGQSLHVAGDISMGGALTVTGHLLPSADDTYDLGSTAKRWRDLYLGPTSLHLFSTASETTTQRDWKIGIDETDGPTDGNLRFMEGASQHMTVTPAGNVGIGTTSPAFRLDVSQASAAQAGLGLKGQSGAFDPSLSSVNNYGGLVIHSRHEVGQPDMVSIVATGEATGNYHSRLSFHTRSLGGGNAVERLRIDEIGNVGIGIASPAQRLNIGYGNLRFDAVPAPTAAPTAALAGAGSGNVDNGAHSYAITYVNGGGETYLGPAASVTVVDKTVNGRVALTSIPVSVNGTVTQRNIYRTKAGTSSLFYFLATINDNTTTTYQDNIADASLPVNYSAVQSGSGEKNNTTAGSLLIDTVPYLVPGESNLSFGRNALGLVAGGRTNTAIGTSALANVRIGTSNVAVGAQALTASAGSYNTAVGTFALLQNTTGGGYNTAVGANSLFSDTTGDTNTAIGGDALYATTTGSNNTALGSAAGNFNTLGSNNTFLGRDADASINNLSRAVAIGYNAVVGCSNCMALGGTGGDSVNVGINTASPITQLHVPGKLPTAATGSVATASQAYGVYVQGRYAYVINEIAGTMQIFDVSNSATPVAVGSVSASVHPRSVYVQGRYAYVTLATSNTLQIFDVSNPASPVSVGSAATGSSPFSVYVQGRYAYVVNFTSNTLRIFDVSDPASPVAVSTTATGNAPYAVSVQGRYAYIVNQSSNTLQIFDISNPASPASVGTVATGSGPRSIYVQGRYAYVANNGGNTFQIFDISNPASPASVGTVATGTQPLTVHVQGRYAYLPNQSSNNFQIFDVSDPASPVSVGTVSTASAPLSLFVQGRFVYVVGGTSSFQVFDVGGSYIQQLEAGGIEAGTLALRNNLYAVDAAFSGGVSIGQSLNVSGSLSVGSSGHFLPTTDDTYDLGSLSKRWRDLYLGPTTLHIASTAAETGTARDYKLSIQEAVGADRGNLRFLEGSTEIFKLTPTGNLTVAGVISTLSTSTTTMNGSLSTPTGGLGSYENFIMYSDQFNNAAWVKTGVTVTADAAAAPDGSTTADQINAGSVATDGVKETANNAYTMLVPFGNKTWTGSVWLRANAGTPTVTLKLDASVVSEVSTQAVTLSTSWQRFSITKTYTTGAGYPIFEIQNGTNVIFAWGAQIEYALTPGVYARTESTPIATSDANTIGRGFVGNGSFLVAGTLADAPTAGSGGRMMWVPNKQAFRAGFVSGSNWDDSNIGTYSVAFGNDTRASGFYSFAGGNQSIASSTNAFAYGAVSNATNFASVAMGSAANATGSVAVALGGNVFATGGSSMALGSDISSGGTVSIGFGHYVNANVDHSIVIGHGVDNSNRLSSNTTESLMVGFNSTIPTLTVTGGSGVGTLGNVGIGDASPLALLTVGSGDLFRIDSSGNASFNGGGTLTLGSKASDPTGANGMTYYNTASNKFRCFQNGAWADCIGSGGAPGGASGAVQFNNAGAFGGDETKFFWDNTNKRLALGHVAPDHAFDIQGASNTVPAAVIRRTTMQTTYGTPYMRVGGEEFVAGGIATIGFGWGNAAMTNNPAAEMGFLMTSPGGSTQGDLVFATRNTTSDVAPTERVRIDAAGNVGIGDSGVDANLDILSTAAANTNVRIANTNAGDFDPTIGFELADTTAQFTMGVDDSDSDKFKIGTSAIETNTRLTIDQAGNVGIGTAGPTDKLNVQTSSSAYGVTHTDGTTTVGTYVDGTAGWYGTKSAHDLKFFVNNGGYNMIIKTGTGRVGVGTGSPSSLFSVAAGVAIGSTYGVSNAAPTNGLIVEGNTGIGETGPVSKLVVKGAGSTSGSSSLNVINSSSASALFVRDDSNVGLGTTAPSYHADIYNTSATSLVTMIRKGAQGAEASLPTAFGSPYLNIGGAEFLLNSTQTIGFGYHDTTSSISPGEIGFLTTSTSQQTKGDLVFATRDVTTNTAPSERMRVDSNGKVGIGDTSPDSILDVEQNQNADAEFSMSNTTSGTAARARVAVNADAGGVVLQQYNSGYTSVGLALADFGQLVATSASSGLVISTNGASPVIFGTNDTERMRILSGGNVGIGTNAPNVPLAIGTATLFSPLTDVLVSASRNGASQNAFFLASTDTSGEDAGIIIGTRQVGEDSAIFMDQSDARKLKISLGTAGDDSGRTSGTRMTFDQTGNVGIGTTGPASRLHVEGAGTTEWMRIKSTASGTAGSLDVYSSGTSGFIAGTTGFNTPDGGALVLAVNNAERMRVHTTGNVGIGDTSPASMFVVGSGELFTVDSSGNVNTVANLSVDGTTTIGNAAGDTMTINGTAVSIPNSLNFDSNTLFVDATNNRVGVGNAAPVTSLHVGSSAPAFAGTADLSMATVKTAAHNFLLIETRNAANIDPGIVFSSSTTAADIAIFEDDTDQMLKIALGVVDGDSDRQTNTKFRINQSGGIFVDLPGTGTANALCHTTQTGTTNEEIVDCTSTPAADYAENYPTAEDVIPGDIVALGEKVVTTKDGETMREFIKASVPYARGVMGVVSDPTKATDFNVIGYNISDEDHPMPIALNGRVSAMVSVENGSIEPGDPITASATMPGAGMKATNAGMIVGFALDAYDDEGPGKLLVFVNPGWWNGIDLQGNTSSSGVTKLAELTIDADKDLMGFGLLNVGFLRGVGGLWSIDESGKLMIQDVDAKNVKAEKVTIKNGGDQKTAGSGTIRVGAIGELVINPLVDSRSLIVVTFEGDTGARWWISEKENGKFMLNLSSPALADTRFTYWIVGIEGGEALPEPLPEPVPVPEPEPVPESEPEPSPEPESMPEQVSQEEPSTDE